MAKVILDTGVLSRFQRPQGSVMMSRRAARRPSFGISIKVTIVPNTPE